jgi:hypothetical protein
MRILFSFVPAVTMFVVAFYGPSVRAAEDKIQEAHIVKVGVDKITLHFQGADAVVTHDIAKDTKITVGGKSATLADLKTNATAIITMNDQQVITKIEVKAKRR